MTTKLHFAIQKMTSLSTAESKEISITAIAEYLTVSKADLFVSLELLRISGFLVYTGTAHEYVKLTYAGIYTTVPDMSFT